MTSWYGLPTCFTTASALWLSQADGSYSNVINVTNAMLYVGNQINAADGSGAYANPINIYSGGFVTTSNGLTIATYPGVATNISGNIINLFGGVLTNGNPSYIGRSSGGAKCVSNGWNVSNGGTLVGKSSLLIGY